MVKRNIGPPVTECACKLIAYSETGLLPNKDEADEFIAASEQIRLGFDCGSDLREATG